MKVFPRLCKCLYRTLLAKLGYRIKRVRETTPTTKLLQEKPFLNCTFANLAGTSTRDEGPTHKPGSKVEMTLGQACVERRSVHGVKAGLGPGGVFIKLPAEWRPVSKRIRKYKILTISQVMARPAHFE
ncbi:hypothetical protein EMCG_04711 [[Emmonsia] crescens]|uniref:Uncharacterized protein n=1 Tax=[Emmonsia] crescens TaxID=73230 RepID=A0A0G2HSB8_9EURO|nr:hypothetical protein EMCG_04711 [Emmonsia crescens UAMH 3008]